MEKNELNKKGFGLLESMIAIGVFGVTIIIGLSLIVKSLRVIKENQVSDQAAAFMVASLEYMRSPIIAPDSIANGSYYKVDLNSSTGEINNIIEETSGDMLGGSACNEISSASIAEAKCTESSPYFVDIDGDESHGTFCNQISVEYVNPSDVENSDYLVRSCIAYKVSTGFKLRETIGFKNRQQ